MEVQQNAAILTTFNELDMTNVMAWRARNKEIFQEKHGIKLGFMSFFAKAACLALKDVPAVNAQIDGDEIVYHDYVDISVAVSAPNGLVVPVVRSVDQMSFAEFEASLGDVAKRVQDGTISMEELTGMTPVASITTSKASLGRSSSPSTASRRTPRTSWRTATIRAADMLRSIRPAF